VDAPPGLFAAPIGENGAAKPASEWIVVAERPGTNPRPWWSPDGSVIYYLSGTQSLQQDIWARRLDPATKKPLGEAFAVYSPPAQRGLASTQAFGPALGSRQLIFPIVERTGNIWLAER